MQTLDLFASSDIACALSEAIREMRDKHPLLSSQSLAKRLGIPNATFDRMAKKEVKNPSFNHAVVIAQEVYGRDSKKIQKFIRKFYPEMTPVLNRWSNLYYKEEAQFLDDKLDRHMADPINYEIFMLVTSSAGVSKETILKKYGERGLEVVEKLQRDELLAERDGKLYADGNFNSTQTTVWRLAQNLLKRNYRTQDFGTGKNWLTVQWESVNPDYVAPRVREILIKTRQKINDVLDSPQAKGDQVIWVGTMMDGLTPYNLNENKESEL